MKIRLNEYAVLILVTIFSMMFIVSCSESDFEPKDEPLGPDTPGFFGETTSAVFVINPVINEGSNTTVVPGTERHNIRIMIEGVDTVYTDSTGLAVLRNIPVGSNNIFVGNNSDTVYLDVVTEKDLYDLVLSYKPESSEHICPSVRYPYDSTAFVYVDSTNIADLDFNEFDNKVYIFDEGSYSIGTSITAENLLFFGSWNKDEGSKTTFTGNVDIRGGFIRLRGVKIEGKVTLYANNFSAAFCTFNSADITGNGISLIRNIFETADYDVPASNAILVDNIFP
jgi:hypothetical protein